LRTPHGRIDVRGENRLPVLNGYFLQRLAHLPANTACGGNQSVNAAISIQDRLAQPVRALRRPEITGVTAHQRVTVKVIQSLRINVHRSNPAALINQGSHNGSAYPLRRARDREHLIFQVQTH
jgi:hypothetical protein